MRARRTRSFDSLYEIYARYFEENNFVTYNKVAFVHNCHINEFGCFTKQELSRIICI